MAEDIKTTLYALLERKNLGCPQYDVNEERRGRGPPKYRCEVRVPNMNYMGVGCSTNKNNAISNAARDLGMYLIREHLCTASELPNLHEDGDMELTQPTTTYRSAGQHPPRFETRNQQLSFISPSMAPRYGDISPPRAYVYRPKTEHDYYEISQLENDDISPEFHGGWVMENCKQGLNEYCVKFKIPMPKYDTREVAADGLKNGFVAEYSIFVAAINKTINGRGEGHSKKSAEGRCALSVIRQLYHHQIVTAAYDEAENQKTKNMANQDGIDRNLPNPRLIVPRASRIKNLNG